MYTLAGVTEAPAKRRSNMLEQLAQGDVLLTKVPGMPVGARRLETKTLALGEATGHHHSVVESELYELDGRVWVVVPDGGDTLVHQEHGPQTLTVGVWEYAPQVEPDPFLGVRRVQD
jgi:hypothetical protein